MRLLLSCTGRRAGLFWPVLPMIFAAFGFLAATDAWACRCLAREVSQHFQQAQRVVVGRVVSVRDAAPGANQQWTPRQVVFRVDEVFKGADVGRELVIESTLPSCELRLQETDRALLFLGQGPQVDACGGSEVFYSDRELPQLSKSEVARRRAHLRGRLEALRAMAPRPWWQVWR